MNTRKTYGLRKIELADRLSREMSALQARWARLLKHKMRVLRKL